MSRRDDALAVLVRAPAGLVYAVLCDVDGWAVWWPGCRTARSRGPVPVAGSGPGPTGRVDHHDLVLPSGRRRLRCRATVHGWRHDAGLRADLDDGAHAAVEWWFEALEDGTVVNLLVSTDGPGAGRVVRALGDGLQALKDHLELAVDVAAGRVP